MSLRFIFKISYVIVFFHDCDKLRLFSGKKYKIRYFEDFNFLLLIRSKKNLKSIRIIKTVTTSSLFQYRVQFFCGSLKMLQKHSKEHHFRKNGHLKLLNV